MTNPIWDATVHFGATTVHGGGPWSQVAGRTECVVAPFPAYPCKLDSTRICGILSVCLAMNSNYRLSPTVWPKALAIGPAQDRIEKAGGGQCNMRKSGHIISCGGYSASDRARRGPTRDTDVAPPELVRKRGPLRESGSTWADC